MTEVQSRAPGKLILVGEHAVVYGRPAIAVPVHGLHAEATVREGSQGSGFTIHADDLKQTISSSDDNDHPLIQTIEQVFDFTKLPHTDIEITLKSTIPMASGFGSGAAVSAAIVQALAKYLGQEISPTNVSEIVYETEKIHHGTPSGIDNTVIALATPIYFVRGESPKPLEVKTPFQIVIGDTGIPVPTHIPVGQVREGWQADRDRFEKMFDEVGEVVKQAASALDNGDLSKLGKLMTANQQVLSRLGVSSTELDKLADGAMKAGALGAKLSGAGQGGNMIALVTEDSANAISEVLVMQGAKAVYRTWVE